MKIRIVAASVLVASMSVVAFGDDDPLTAAKTLYQSASYQDALAALSNLPSGANIDEADKYRALCFLGLNRAQDAEHALEQLVTRRPLFKLDPSFDSPKLVATFRDRAGLEAYTVHPVHVAAADFGRGVSEHVVSVDFEEEEGDE